MTIHVNFEPVGRRGEFPSAQSLLDCARQLGVDLVNLCGGAGSCGRCRVQIVDGDVSEPSHGESEFLSPEDLAAGYRLACQAVPLSDCLVRVPPESLTAPQRTQVEGEEIPVVLDPLVQTYLVSLTPPSLDDLRADAVRLSEALVQQHGVVASTLALPVMRELSPRMRAEDWQIRVAVREGKVVALLSRVAHPLGLAVDLGTTKLAAYLVDLETGKTLATRGIMNPQISYGEDIVARMAFAQRDPAGAGRLQESVVDALNQAAVEMCAEAGTAPDEIVESVVVGNTAMHHLFLGLPVMQLARAPYVPAIVSAMDVEANALGLDLAPAATVHLLANIAGYVGADHVAMLLATRVAQREGVVLAIDIGTNTEVCLANHGTLTSVSCASGPAFEGAHIRHGMRASPGAIEHLRLVDSQLEFQVIGGGQPSGLCGSGILDALAELYLAGIVSHDGRMGEHPRVRGEGAKREFVLVGEDERSHGRRAITFTQKDVRELQLAKGAMRTGIDVLLKANGLMADDIDQVIIAGAFGSYINVASAIAIGMLPRLPLDRFRQVGNAAGIGAKQALISRGKRSEAEALASRVGYIELASVPQFAKTFAKAMYLA
jgi:uncharacterized 2Fe-2S/4Fe-4S cluster protein (DUF4445 family)